MTEPMDELDLSILDNLATVYSVVDPPPPELDLRVRFALDLEDLDNEVARRTEDELVGSGARSSERTRTITFEADSRTVMITVVERPDGLVRMDGWLAPAAALRVELRVAEPADTRSELADETGRFVFDEVPRGLAQLLVHPPDDAAPRVVTPSITL